MNKSLGVLLRVLGISALVAGGVALALSVLLLVVLLGPLIFWLAWNVLDFAAAVGLPELGFWGIVLATLFLVVGWGGKVLIAGIVFLVDPSWFRALPGCAGPSPRSATSSRSCCSRSWRHGRTRAHASADPAELRRCRCETASRRSVS